MTDQPVDLHHRFDGPPDAPVLVLSHSLGLSMVMWEPVLPRLTARFRVLRYDHRGHGGSPSPPGRYAIADFGRDLVGLLDRLELDPVSFCGLSLGGMVGQWLGANASDRVTRLVLCCTAPKMLRPEDFTARAAAVRANGMASVADAAIGRWFTPEFLARRPEAVEPLRAALLAANVDGYAATCEAIARMDLREDLERIRAPTLVLAGGADAVTPPGQADEMAQRIPGAQAVVIPGAPHIASVEQPDAVADQILRWVLSSTS